MAALVYVKRQQYPVVHNCLAGSAIGVGLKVFIRPVDTRQTQSRSF